MPASAHASTAAKPELLAPAGGWEQLEYAIAFGADAVYLASERFGMRQKAANFALDDLPRAVGYAHDRGVAVHVTVNVSMRNDDLADLSRYFEQLEAAHVDAAIVADLGAAVLARRHAPHVALHASTQANVTNTQAALVWRDLGASRIVCARELSLAEIARMRSELPDNLELEAFVHGSMCMAYSGRCLISDYLTGRSANEGHCTQSCRWSYALMEAKRPGEYFPVEQDGRGSYILNSCDLCMLDHLGDLARAGVDSLKIEGRNKKAFYVATVVNAYRQVLDGADAAAFAGELEVFSHRPYSTGFFYGPAHQAPLSEKGTQLYDWVADVLGCTRLQGGAWEARVRCRNRFRTGDELEVLSPGRPVRKLVARDTRWVPGANAQDTQQGDPIPVEIASRGMETYLLTSPFELHERDVLRLKRPEAR